MTYDTQELAARARSIRRRIIRLTGSKGFGHTGGSLSEADILTALYFDVMRVDPASPSWPERDRFVLSKGHSTPGYYGALAERGYFAEAELLHEFDEVGGRFQGHPDMTKTPGVDMTTGSLGQGLSAGIGMALGLGRRGCREATVFVLMGDGEIQEGQVWEAVMYAGFHKVPRLVAILDNNRLQLSETTPQVLDLMPIEPKVQAFGWRSLRCDGHDFAKLVPTLREAKHLAESGPVFVVADTVKGKGVSFIENRVEWHSRAPNKDEVTRALAELG